MTDEPCSNVIDDYDISFRVMCSPQPIPMTSVLVQYTSSTDVQWAKAQRGSTTDDLQDQPLLQSCLKRLLVGSQVRIDGENEEDPPPLQVSFDGRTWTFLVRSFAFSHSQKVNVPSVTKGIILPSTMITFERRLDPPSSSLSIPFSTVDSSDNTFNEPTILISPAAHLLEDTIRCLRLIQHNRHSSADIPRTFLLSGPPGVGKTHAVRCAVQQGDCHLIVLQGSQLLAAGGSANAAAKRLERTFSHAIRDMRNSKSNEKRVTLIFLDECDALLASPEESSSFQVIPATLGRILDEINAATDPAWQRLIVVAATNRVDMIPGTLRRPGRFDREIPFSPPDVDTRVEILKSLLGRKESILDDELSELRAIAEACVGYVPADLAALVRRVELLRVQRCLVEDIDDRVFSSSSRDLWAQAMTDVGASALRDAALQAPPTTTWDDVAGDPGGAKTALRQAIEWPRIHREHYRRLGLKAPRGILLHGPPGCAKTTLARAAAGASAVSFFSFSPADVFSTSYVGDAEAVVRRAFTLARSAAPSIIFFDELDALVGTNGNHHGFGMGRGSSGSATEARVLSTFLNEMDGVDGSWQDGVLVLGATNRPWTLDAALLRPGRFDKIIYVPPPDYEGRRAIFSMHCQHWGTQHRALGTIPVPTIDVDYLASDAVSGNMTGAEIVGACREAAMLCLRNTFQNTSSDAGIEQLVMKEVYLIIALKNVRPLLSNPTAMKDFESFQSHRTRS
jgi:SpoVK/Ycf46/Vps4 family AAA+-type ATPase